MVYVGLCCEVDDFWFVWVFVDLESFVVKVVCVSVFFEGGLCGGLFF